MSRFGHLNYAPSELGAAVADVTHTVAGLTDGLSSIHHDEL